MSETGRDNGPHLGGGVHQNRGPLSDHPPHYSDSTQLRHVNVFCNDCDVIVECA